MQLAEEKVILKNCLPIQIDRLVQIFHNEK